MKRLLSSIILLSSILLSCSGNPVIPKENVSVSVEKSEFYKITSENPITIKRGDDAVFDIDFNKGCEFKYASNAEYVNGQIISKNVQYSQTIHIEVAQYYTVYIETERNKEVIANLVG